MVPYPHDRNLDASARYFASRVLLPRSTASSKLACFLILEAPPIDAKYILPSFALRMQREIDHSCACNKSQDPAMIVCPQQKNFICAS
jgi:hypothetical protein